VQLAAGCILRSPWLQLGVGVAASLPPLLKNKIVQFSKGIDMELWTMGVFLPLTCLFSLRAAVGWERHLRFGDPDFTFLIHMGVGSTYLGHACSVQSLQLL